VALPLAEPAPGLAQQCEGAASSLGFAVPCPTRLPLIDGEPADCSGSCIGLAGEKGAEVRSFFLNIEGYDANADAPGTVRHLIVEAQKVQDAPPSPCYEGVPVGALEADLLGEPRGSLRRERPRDNCRQPRAPGASDLVDRDHPTVASEGQHRFAARCASRSVASPEEAAWARFGRERGAERRLWRNRRAGLTSRRVLPQEPVGTSGTMVIST
jgi:hypothetical protein